MVGESEGGSAQTWISFSIFKLLPPSSQGNSIPLRLVNYFLGGISFFPHQNLPNYDIFQLGRVKHIRRRVPTLACFAYASSLSKVRVALGVVVSSGTNPPSRVPQITDLVYSGLHSDFDPSTTRAENAKTSEGACIISFSAQDMSLLLLPRLLDRHLLRLWTLRQVGAFLLGQCLLCSVRRMEQVRTVINGVTVLLHNQSRT